MNSCQFFDLFKSLITHIPSVFFGLKLQSRMIYYPNNSCTSVEETVFCKMNITYCGTFYTNKILYIFSKWNNKDCLLLDTLYFIQMPSFFKKYIYICIWCTHLKVSSDFFLLSLWGRKVCTYFLEDKIVIVFPNIWNSWLRLGSSVSV